MTRYLSTALGAREPEFSQSIRLLEHAAGSPSADIRLTSEVATALRNKIAQLGLDPKDTTAEELYAALRQRMQQDEIVAREALGVGAAQDGSFMSRVQQFLRTHDAPKVCFALKAVVAKKLLAKKPPKNAMKRLGYRSVDSLLKHESVAELYAAAALAESPTWHKMFREQYLQLTPSDFETRPVAMFAPNSKHWQTLSEHALQQQKQPVMSFRELGAVVLLPVPYAEQIDGIAMATLLLGLHELNLIRAYSSFVKLQQVRPEFGRIVRDTAYADPLTGASLAGQPVPWRMIHRYYARFTDAYHPEVFEPHVQQEDLHWHRGEDALAKLAPSLSFWQDAEFLALVQGDKAVSLNALDVALASCNKLPFEQRVVHFVRDNLWHELMTRYMHQENLEFAVHQQLSRELAGEQSETQEI